MVVIPLRPFKAYYILSSMYPNIEVLRKLIIRAITPKRATNKSPPLKGGMTKTLIKSNDLIL